MNEILVKIQADRRRDMEARAVRKEICDECECAGVKNDDKIECDCVFGSDRCASKLLMYFVRLTS